MATNNAISFNQLKKSVFNMKNYNDQSIQEIYNNINRPYIENNEKIIKLQTKVNDDGKLDKTGFSTSRENATGILGNQVIMNYDDVGLYNIITNSLNKLHIIMKLDENIIIDERTNSPTTSITKYYYPEKPEGFDGTYYFRVIIGKNKICNSSGNFENAIGKFYVSIIYAHAEALTDFIKGNIKVEIHGLEINKNNITSIYGLKELSEGKYTLGVDYDYKDRYVGNCSINFGNSDVPSYSYITGLNDFGIKDGTYTYPATSNHLSIFGYNNKFKMIKHGFIAGYNNVLDAYYTGAGIQGCLCIGRNNNFTEEKANRDYYIAMIGQNIKAVQSGLFIGTYGTIPATEMFALCNGTSKEDKVLLSVNRNTGAVTSISTPTENNHLTTKKYVDGKVAGVVNSAPETLDTLQELATALGNDPNFATTVATQIGKKVDKVDGMSLTHNDLTNELKANYDAAYTYSQAKHSYNDLTDKPTIPSIDGLATTKYVDDKAVNKYTQLKDTPIEVFPYTEKLNSITNTTQKICAVNAADLKGNTTYMCPDNCGRLGIKYTKLDNTEIAFFLSYNTNNLIIQTGYKDDKKIEILIDGIVYTVTFKTATEEPNAVKTVRYLTDKNTVEFTPTKDYQPSTKKYVDDTIVFKKLSSIVELNSDKKIINVEKFEDNKVYYFINDINEGTTTLIPILLYKGGEKNSIIMIYPNDRFITMSYSVSKNEFFSFSDMQSVKYNLVDKTREYNTSRSVTKKVSAEQVLTKTNTTEFTPTSDYHPTTKKYVDDKVVGLATESYVDSKTSMENVIYEGNGTGADVISDYWTGCPVVSGNGCWVINKQIEFDSSKPNPYYLLCDNTLYSPEKSTFDKTNSAWIYPKVPNRGTIFICNKYNNENKLVLPWDDVGNPQKIKLYTKTELAKAMFSGDYNDLSNKPTIPSIKGLATEEYVNNKVTDTATSLTNDPDIYLNKDKYQYVTGVNTVNNMIWLPSTDLPAFLKIHLYVTNCKMQCVFDTPVKWKISQKPNEGTFKIVTDNIYEFILTYINGSWIGEIVTYSDTEYTPTNDADITTKKYVDDRLNNLNIKTVTQSEYDSLSTKEPNTLYLITD